MAIDIGAAATDRGSTAASGYTLINLSNPANASGWITSIEIWAASDMGGVIVGSYYTSDSVNYTCRDVVIIGAVSSGSKQTFNTHYLWVETGDYIGIYFTSGTIERDTSGGSNFAHINSAITNINQSGSFATTTNNDCISLYGSGSEASITSIGDLPINRANNTAASYTHVINYPSTVTGTVRKILCYVAGASTFEFASFSASGDNMTTIDTYNAGSLGKGLNGVYPDLDISSGQYVGFYSAGTLDRADGSRDYWYASGDYIPCTSQAFTNSATLRDISLWALIEESGTTGWTNIAKVCGVTATDLSKVVGIAVADIAKINGVAV